MTVSAPEALRVEGLSKLYRRMAPGAQMRTLKSALLERSLIGNLREGEAITALCDVNFSVRAGEAFGVIGGNGSGKSTLLKILAGILQPTSGQVSVQGRVAALIELGAGFHPEISGRENVFINGVLLGLTRSQVEARYESIVEFSGLREFMDEPVKNYSSGMYVRLGFAVAVHTDPDVLLVDEVLAVGDEAFAHRCVRRIEEFLAAGKTLLMVSHSLDLVQRLCDRVLWLDRGHPRLEGMPRRVVDAYRQAVAEEEGRIHQEEAHQEETQDGEDGEPQEVLRWGSREAEILSVRILDAAGRERYHLESGEAMTVEMEVVPRRPLRDFVFGVAVSTPRGVECWGTNTELAGFEPASFHGPVRVRLVCPNLRLAPGEYLLDVAAHAKDGTPYDYRRKVLGLTVTAADRGIGLYFPEHEWAFEGDLSWQRDPESSQGEPPSSP